MNSLIPFPPRDRTASRSPLSTLDGIILVPEDTYTNSYSQYQSCHGKGVAQSPRGSTGKMYYPMRTEAAKIGKDMDRKSAGKIHT